MTHTSGTSAIDAAFEILDWQEETYDEPADGPKLTRVTITKRYRGEIEGDGIAHVLTTQGPDGAGYVASERIVGTLDGRAGSFVIQHGGLMEGSDPSVPGASSTFGTVVPGSATGALTGLRGSAGEVQHGVLTLHYDGLS